MIDLRHGDCLEVMKTIPDGSVDMILCDLPYGCTACKWDAVIPFKPMWEQYARVIKKNGAVVLFGSEPFSSCLRLSNVTQYKYDWIWEKGEATGHLNAKKQPLRAHETISVFCQGQSVYNPQKTHGHERKVSAKGDQNTPIYGLQTRRVPYDSTSRYPRTVLRFSKDKQKIALHPTQKPVPLLEYLIRTYTNENETVFDNCMGSGSTGVAAMNLNRKFIGMELDAKYFEIAKQRIEAALVAKG